MYMQREYLCLNCRQYKAKSRFRANKTFKSGIIKVCLVCEKTKPSKRVLKELAHENREYIVRYLSSHPCVDCGNASLVVLTFDHVRGIKNFAIGGGHTTPVDLSSLKKEIKKCDVVCANCHLERTAKTRHWWRTRLEVSSLD